MRALTVVLVSLLVATSGCTQIVDAFQDGGLAGPGAHYEAYLAGTADRLVVELDYAPGALWDTSTNADEDFVSELERITDKEVVVEASQDLPRKGPDYAYSMQELRALHADHQDLESGNGTVVMHALFLDGEFEAEVAGLAYDEDAFALFKGTIRERTCSNDADSCNGPVQAIGSALGQNDPAVREWKVTRAVAIHEAGHLLGLVNSPLPMIEEHEMTQDPKPDTPQNEGEAHSTNENSVMFWRVEATGEDGLDTLIEGGDVPWRFDGNDLQDARAIQGQG